jgi:ferritin-like metal-binding protein YciE
MAKSKTLHVLFTDAVKDLYFAEKKILVALPKMAKAAQNEKLSAAFEKHLAETEAQIERLEGVFQELDENPKSKKCPAIIGIIEEGQEVMKEYKGSPALDAGLLAAAQAVEHYEICRYGTMVTWAQQLGLRQSVRLLKQTLNEEEKTDQALSKLAEGAINAEALAEAAE